MSLALLAEAIQPNGKPFCRARKIAVKAGRRQTRRPAGADKLRHCRSKAFRIRGSPPDERTTAPLVWQRVRHRRPS